MKLWETFILKDRLVDRLHLKNTTFHSHYDKPAFSVREDWKIRKEVEVEMDNVIFFCYGEVADKIKEVLAIPELHDIYKAVVELENIYVGKRILCHSSFNKPHFIAYSQLWDSIVESSYSCADYTLDCEPGRDKDESIALLKKEYDVSEITMKYYKESMR